MTGGSLEAAGTPRSTELPVGATATPEERDAAIADGLHATEPGGLPPDGGTIEGTRFAHASEAEMARILDFYAVRWEYEPTTFPILWNLDGDVVESFAPDFYLPDVDLFLELTTLKQRLVRKKNRKLRRLRELYPDIRIKLFYARDFRAMMLKYGRLGLAQSLSGTLGQVVSERALAVPPIAAVEVMEEAVAGPADPTGQAAAVLEPAPAVKADRTTVPAGPRATPRTRPGRRRRRPRQANESGAEREAGA